MTGRDLTASVIKPNLKTRRPHDIISDCNKMTVTHLGGGAVEVEPPIADEVVLVEEGSVGTEEAVLSQTYNI